MLSLICSFITSEVENHFASRYIVIFFSVDYFICSFYFSLPKLVILLKIFKVFLLVKEINICILVFYKYFSHLYFKGFIFFCSTYLIVMNGKTDENLP